MAPAELKVSKKICMLGTFGVGKTSLVRRFVYQKFDESYLSTIGVQLSNKSVTLQNQGNSVHMNLILWDLAHLEKFDAVVKNYFHGSHGAVVVMDLTRPQSFHEYENLIRPFFEVNPNSKIVLVGNKTDIEEANKTKTQVVELANELTCPYFFTSAKTGEQVEEMFVELAASLM